MFYSNSIREQPKVWNLALNLIVIVIMSIIGVVALAHIQPASAASNCTNLTYKRNSHGACVTYIQQMSNGISKTGSDVSEDGAFGAKTVTKVKAVQRKYDASQDGTVGKNTWRLLCKYTSDRTAASNAGCSHIAYVYACSIKSMPASIKKNGTFTAKVSFKNNGTETFTDNNSNPVMIVTSGSSIIGEETPLHSDYTISSGSSKTITFGPRGSSNMKKGKTYTIKFVMYKASGGSSISTMSGSSCSQKLTIK